jgi:hypothetical protein
MIDNKFNTIKVDNIKLDKSFFYLYLKPTLKLYGSICI